MAACGSIPSLIQLITLNSVAEIMVGPPGEPVTKLSLPSRTRIVGVIELSGRCPGAMAFASDCINPNSAFGTPGCVVKSSISSFSKNPAVLVTCDPYQLFSVYVLATAFPAASTTEKCVVCGPSPKLTSVDSVAPVAATPHACGLPACTSLLEDARCASIVPANSFA